MISAIATVLVIVGLLLIPIGLLGMVKPQFLRLNSRWYVTPIVFAFSLTFGAAMIISPAGSQGDAADVRVSGLAGVLIWTAIAAFARLMAVRLPRRHAIKPPLLERMAAAYGEAVAKERERADVRRLDRAIENRQSGFRRVPVKQKVEPLFRFDANRPRKESGETADFEYVDANGEVTDRSINNWAIDGYYIKGYCTLRRATRQFRLDRVTQWRSWS